MDPFDLGPGFVVGGPDIFIGEPRWYEAVAKTDVILLKQELTTTLDVFEDHIEVAMALLKTVAASFIDKLEEMAAAQAAASRTGADADDGDGEYE
ncbi:MAG: hypothetical protein JRI68_16555, partial [Deltaproteobacteria bacterium]|nr:hypothetical protein [Deltaproteobacteria bacterium]